MLKVSEVLPTKITATANSDKRSPRVSDNAVIQPLLKTDRPEHSVP